MKRWYVVETQPQAETKALWHLERQGYTVYLPRYRKRRRHARRTEVVQAPLFPRYLFVQVDIVRAAWRAIRSTIGVARLVSQGDQPAPVPDEIIEEIRARQDASGLVKLLPAFDKGERVNIIEGALRGASALFDCVTDGERAILLLDLMGRRVRVQVPLETVQAAA